MLIGCFPIFRIWLIWKMTGTVHFPSMPEAFQFAVDSVSMVKVVWVFVVYEMNGWTNIWLTLLRSSEITTDQSWFISAPIVHGPACFNTTKVGPIENVPVSSNGCVPVGERNAGPRPKISPNG